jgi:hypothetical protein
VLDGICMVLEILFIAVVFCFFWALAMGGR